MSAGQRLRIEGEFTIFRAMDLKPVLFAEPPVTEVDLSAVSEFDSAGLQLLMLAKRTAQAQGRPFQLTGHSEAVIDVFELLNVAGYFGDPLLMNSPPKPGAGAGSSASAGASRGSDGS